MGYWGIEMNCVLRLIVVSASFLVFPLATWYLVTVIVPAKKIHRRASSSLSSSNIAETSLESTEAPAILFAN